MEYLVTRGKSTERMTEQELNELIGLKVTPYFMQLLRKLKLNEDLYHYETKINIKRIK